jgi:hypothetical protein
LEAVSDVCNKQDDVIEFLVDEKVSVETSTDVSAMLMEVLQTTEAPLVAGRKE